MVMVLILIAKGISTSVVFNARLLLLSLSELLALEV